jgi:hypothetical protein
MIDVAEEDKRETLIEQSTRVIERRLSGMDDELVDSGVDKTESGVLLTITVKNEEVLEALTDQLQRPFKLRIMSEVPANNADIVVEGHGGFDETGITEEDLSWVEGRQQVGTEFGEVELDFTEEGRQKMSALFAQMKGKNIGLFVRDQLVSKLFVDTGELKDTIVIREIPQAELAIVFADDLNVGIHVVFTKAP